MINEIFKPAFLAFERAFHELERQQTELNRVRKEAEEAFALLNADNDRVNNEQLQRILTDNNISDERN